MEWEREKGVSVALKREAGGLRKEVNGERSLRREAEKSVERERDVCMGMMEKMEHTLQVHEQSTEAEKSRHALEISRIEASWSKKALEDTP